MDFRTRSNRRDLLKAGAALTATASGLGLGTGLAQDQSEKTGVDPDQWTPEYIREIAGTYEPDTAADVAAVTQLDHEGKFDLWYVGPDQATPQIQIDKEAEFWAAWSETYPNIPMEDGDNVLNIGYNDLLDKVRTAATGSAAPNVARMPILWGVEFAARGQLQELNLEDFGFSEEDFWPGALKSCRWQDRLYGIPTNNETMAFIWNAKMFEEATRSGHPARNVGRCGGVLQGDQGSDRQGRLRAGRARERRQHTIPVHADALGLR